MKIFPEFLTSNKQTIVYFFFFGEHALVTRVSLSRRRVTVSYNNPW
jgi:hypothetical protein